MSSDKTLSLDELDLLSFKAGPSPTAEYGMEVTLGKQSQPTDYKAKTISLNGHWILIEGGEEKDRLTSVWEDEIPADIPCSVHKALFDAGKIPDPSVGRNQIIARESSYKTWWLKKVFSYKKDDCPVRLEFDGIANRCTIWLNGHEISKHEGMFGGPYIDITDILQPLNTLIVKLEAIPFEADSFFSPETNQSWKDTVVINNVYGWHYSNMPSLGIWNDVRLMLVPKGEIKDPFLFVRDLELGKAGLVLTVNSLEADLKGNLAVEFIPKNFKGDTYSYTHSHTLNLGKNEIRFEITVPNHKLWWPNDLGEQNLYSVKITFIPEDGSNPSVTKQNFGFRTIEMAPLPEGPNPEKCNWTHVINGKKLFVKGSGWCTMDAMLDFTRERYDRFLLLAKDQHIQMLRAWGCGMPEKYDFYDLCDLYGIMVMQEWPTAWESDKRQPFDILERTVIDHTKRLRNHPSLIMYGGGNESNDPHSPALDQFGKLSVELDGTRPFHMGEPYGGSRHNYTVYWGRASMDVNLKLEADFWGEFGIASMPSYESFLKYIPDEEKGLWPPESGSSFSYHTPVFGNFRDVEALRQYAGYFVPENCTASEFIMGSQLSQALGVRPVLERARARFPYCTGALYYKLNDNFPAASWSSVDWYGVPKLAHYVFQDAFSPLHACALFDSFHFSGTQMMLHIHVMDDNDELKDSKWTVRTKIYKSDLSVLKIVEHMNEGSIDKTKKTGEIILWYDETASEPLIIVCEVEKNGRVVDRSFYPCNYEYKKGSLFRFPRTSLSYKIDGNEVTVINHSDIPAVGVYLGIAGQLDTFRVSDNFFFMEPHEMKTVNVNETKGLTVSALNSFNTL